MKSNLFFKKENMTVMETIQLYKKGLMEDVNLTLRLTDNNHTYITKPIEWADAILIFEAPMSQLEYVLYPKNTKLQLAVVSKIALFSCEIMILRNYRKENTLYYVSQIVSPLIKKQQREAFRLDTLVPLTYKIIATEESNFEEVESHNLPSYKGTCINISVGGLCLNCETQLQSRIKLEMSFTFVDTPLTLYGEVLFIGEPTKTNTYNHRIKFYGLSISDVNRLNRLIFEKQRLQLKKL